MRHLGFLKLAFAGVVLVAVVSSGLALGANPFVDVPAGKFYADPVDWAYNNGITTGSPAGSDTFKPDDPVTRGENVTFAKRYDDNVVQPALDALEAADSRHHWIWVNGGNGSTIAGSAGVSAVRNSVGFYTVTFPEDITECAWSSTQRNAGGLIFVLFGDIDIVHQLSQGGDLSFLPVVSFTENPMEIDLTAWDISDAANADDNFQLDVVC